MTDKDAKIDEDSDKVLRLIRILDTIALELSGGDPSIAVSAFSSLTFQMLADISRHRFENGKELIVEHAQKFTALAAAKDFAELRQIMLALSDGVIRGDGTHVRTKTV